MGTRLEGKVCIVTGAGRGIGRAVAREFARESAGVVVNDVDASSADSVAAEIRAEGGRAATNNDPVGSVAAGEIAGADGAGGVR